MVDETMFQAALLKAGHTISTDFGARSTCT